MLWSTAAAAGADAAGSECSAQVRCSGPTPRGDAVSGPAQVARVRDRRARDRGGRRADLQGKNPRSGAGADSGAGLQSGYYDSALTTRTPSTGWTPWAQARAAAR